MRLRKGTKMGILRHLITYDIQSTVVVGRCIFILIGLTGWEIFLKSLDKFTGSLTGYINRRSHIMIPQLVRSLEPAIAGEPISSDLVNSTTCCDKFSVPINNAPKFKDSKI